VYQERHEGQEEEDVAALLKENKDVNDLIHVSPKQILTLTTFHKVN
jgi:hypothetical protein